jgi:hypothetical protein
MQEIWMDLGGRVFDANNCPLQTMWQFLEADS